MLAYLSFPTWLSAEIIPGLLNFIYVRNTGVAFGLFPSNGNLWATVTLTVLGLAALTIVASWQFATPAAEPSMTPRWPPHHPGPVVTAPRRSS